MTRHLASTISWALLLAAAVTYMLVSPQPAPTDPQTVIACEDYSDSATAQQSIMVDASDAYLAAERAGDTDEMRTQQARYWRADRAYKATMKECNR